MKLLKFSLYFENTLYIFKHKTAFIYNFNTIFESKNV